MLNLFATCPKGLELLLVEELRQLGAHDPKEKLAGVTFSGDLALAYRACLWSRLANRVLLQLKEFPAETPEDLYDGIQTIDWDEHLEPTGTLRVNFVSSKSEMNHSLYGAQKVKDAIVDQFRDQYGERPSVSDRPDVNVYVFLNKNIAAISLDLSGDSLHKRGYRLAQGAAPLKENLAAALLLRAKWPEIAKSGGALFDPMCGSGTLLIEAAMMAGDIAPGLGRDYFGFLGWKQHDHKTWQSIWEEAAERAELGYKTIPPIVGCDQDSIILQIALENIERAELNDKIHIEKKTLADQPFPFAKEVNHGLVITNPPYGERLGEMDELSVLYSELGDCLKQQYLGWEAAVFTGNPLLGKSMGLRSYHRYKLFNGTIPCELLLFHVQREWFKAAVVK